MSLPDVEFGRTGPFAGRVINEGTGVIGLDLPCVVQRGEEVFASVEVNWPVVLAKAVSHLYLFADGNRVPQLARIPLIPDLVPPHVRVKVRLDETGYVRAVVECGDGTLLQVSRWAWVMPPDRSLARFTSTGAARATQGDKPCSSSGAGS